MAKWELVITEIGAIQAQNLAGGEEDEVGHRSTFRKGVVLDIGI
jgi:hypothetical protein